MAYQPKSYRKFLATSVAAAVVATAVAPSAIGAADHSFSDVETGVWYEEHLEFAIEAGFIEGFSDDTFRPREGVTRAQAATMVMKALDLDVPADTSLDYTDTVDGGWYEEAIAAVSAADIMEGDAAGTFRPGDVMSRAEFAAVMVRAYDLELNASAVVDFSDINDEWYADDVKVLASLGIVQGYEGAYSPKGDVLRQESVAFVHRTVDPEQRLEVELNELTVQSVSAINGTTVRVNFNQAVEDVDFTNFSVNGGKTVVDATLSESGTYADVEVNTAFTRNQEYTVTSSDITPANSDVEASDFTNDFKWSVDDGLTVNLKSSLDVGETALLEILDQDGKDVTSDDVEITSSNTNIVTIVSEGGNDTGVKGKAEGSAEVTVKVTLADDTVLRSTYTVNVEAIDDVIESQGFTFEHPLAGVPENTVAFEDGPKVTSLTVGDSGEQVYMYDTVNSDPETTHILDFTDAKVTSHNPTIATASINAAEDALFVSASASQTGTASFTVEFSDGTERDFDVEVNEKAEFTDLTLSSTSITLSDEVASGGNEDGVNQQEITVTSRDQFATKYSFDEAEKNLGKVTVSVDTDGLELYDSNAGDKVGNQLVFGGSDSVEFGVRAKNDEIVTGTVTITYFEPGAETASFTKTLDVDVVDVKDDATVTGIDVVSDTTSIYAHDTAPRVDAIDFATDNVIYSLDSDGNRLDVATYADVDFATGHSSDWVEFDTTTTSQVQFVNKADAKLYMTEDSSIDVVLTADTGSGEVSQTLTVDYFNGASVPTTASVNTTPSAIKLDNESTLTIEELLFGLVDATDGQLVIDEDPASDIIIAVKNAAKNAGYVYNEPVLTFADQDGEALPLGVNLYGALDTITTGNQWRVSDASGFDVEFQVANWNADIETAANEIDPSTITTLGDSLGTLEEGDAITFTLVVNKVYVSGANGSDYNLLETPVSINYTVTK